MTGRDGYAHKMSSNGARAASRAVQVPRQAPQHDGARRPVTIARIAEETGLSTATVSKVLNGKPDVSPRTRKLVQDVLLSSGYRKRGAAMRRR